MSSSAEIETPRGMAEREAILSQLAEGVIVTDAAGRITFVNEAAERLHGAKLLDVGPDRYAAAYSLFTETGDPYPSHELPLARATLRGEIVEGARWRIRRPDGTEILAIGSARPVIGPDGERVGAVLTVRDDTARHAAETALRESEARLAFLDRLGAVTAVLSDADAVLATTTRMLGEHLDLSVCAYADMDEDTDGFTIRGDWAAPGARSIVGHYSLADFGRLAVERLGAGLPLVVMDNLRELAAHEAATFQEIGIAATVCMPLVKNGRLAALMAIHDSVPRAWTESEIALLRAVTARSWAHVERVAAAAELRAREAQLRAVFDQAAAGLARTDFTGRFTEVNDRYCAIVGRSRAELTGLTMQEITHPDDLTSNLPLFAAAADGGAPFDIEKRYLRPDGSVVWVRNSVSAVREDGTAPSILAVSVDISDRKATEQRLQESEARLERALEAGGLGAWELDLQTLAAWRSPQHDRIFGYAEMLPEWTYATFLGHVAPEDRERVDAAFRAAIDGGGLWDFECRIRRVDGSEAWISAQGKVDVGAGGARGRIKGMLRDVTARRRTEEALRELNETLAARVAERTAERDRMWRLSSDVMLVARFDGTVDAVNPAWETLLGWTETELVRTTSWRWCTPTTSRRPAPRWPASAPARRRCASRTATAPATAPGAGSPGRPCPRRGASTRWAAT